MSGFPPFARCDGLGLAALVRAGAVEPLDLVEETARRIEAWNPVLNAVIHPLLDSARATARATPPTGDPTDAHQPWRVPFLLKDLGVGMHGAPLTSGSRLFPTTPCRGDSELVRRYREAGLIVAGTTNTPELGLLPVTEPERYGPTRNPWDLERTPGGSSGGSAAAVAAGMVPWAAAGDGGGSIRIPAACCGLFGFKPSFGRTPIDPRRGSSWCGFVQLHAVTRSVQDSAAILDRTGRCGLWSSADRREGRFLDQVHRPPGRLRVAVTAEPFLGGELHPECGEGLRRTARLVEELGHEVVEARPPLDAHGFRRSFLAVVAGEVAKEVERARREGLRPGPATLEAETWALGLVGRAMGPEAMTDALRRLEREAEGVLAFFRHHDVLLTPTLPTPPPPLGAVRPGPAERAALALLGRGRAGRLLLGLGALDRAAEPAFRITAYTPVFNVTGQPAMSVPLERTGEGLPVGMHFAAAPGRDHLLFRLAGQLERARPWAHRFPGGFPAEGPG